jgi:hypothetical protein
LNIEDSRVKNILLHLIQKILNESGCFSHSSWAQKKGKAVLKGIVLYKITAIRGIFELKKIRTQSHEVV